MRTNIWSMAKISTIFVTSLRSVRNMAVARIGRFKLTGEGACGDCVRQEQKKLQKKIIIFFVPALHRHHPLPSPVSPSALSRKNIMVRHFVRNHLAARTVKILTKYSPSTRLSKIYGFIILITVFYRHLKFTIKEVAHQYKSAVTSKKLHKIYIDVAFYSPFKNLWFYYADNTFLPPLKI